MSFCSFSRDSAMFDSTPIENMFLLEYLPHVPGDCLRVYLYGRMLCFHPEMGSDISDIAKALRMDEEAILEAFRFWEQQGLVEKMSDRPPSYSFHSLNGGVIARENDDVRKHLDYNFEILNILGVTSIGSKQTRMAFEWMDVLGYSQEAALEILRYEKKVSGKFSPATIINRANKRAYEWADRGIHTLEDVKRAVLYGDQVHNTAKAVLKQLAISRKATNDELDCVHRWINEWKFSESDILAECAKTTKSRSPSVGYLDAILKGKLDLDINRNFEPVKSILKALGASGIVPTIEQQKEYSLLLKSGFEPETLMLAATQCANKGLHTFDKFKWMLQEWEDAGVHSLAQAEAYLSRKQQMRDELRNIYKAAKLNRTIYAGDIVLYENWKQKYTHEMIQYAAECARATREPTKYMDKLLTEWEKSGVSTPEAARAQHRSISKTVVQPETSNYQQHEYTEADFGEDFFYNPANDYKNGGEGK